MKYIKLLKFDIQNGILKKITLFITPVIISLISCLDLANKITVMNREGFHPSKFQASFSNYIAYLYGGMAEYVPDPNNPFIFPVRWLVVFLLILFLTLNYPYDDMQSFGQQILIRTKGRSLWWLAKCGWNICCTLVYHFIIYLTTLIFCLATNADVISGIDSNLLNVVFSTNRATQVPGNKVLPFSILLLPIAMSIGITLLQMVLSLFIKPIFSFLVLSLLMLSSAYFMSPFWIGNYAMLVRYDLMHTRGVHITAGIITSIVLICLAFIVGLIRFRYYDILNRD